MFAYRKFLPRARSFSRRPLSPIRASRRARRPPGSTYKAVLRMPHGCDGTADREGARDDPGGPDRREADAEARMDDRDYAGTVRETPTPYFHSPRFPRA